VSLLSIAVLLLLAALSIVYYSARYGISPMPTWGKAKQAVLEALPQEYCGPIVDLGSGWGSLVFPLSRRYPHSEVVGYEISLIPWLFTRFCQCLFPRKNLRVYRRDFLSVPLHDYSLVVCYLYPGAMAQLKEKFEKELCPGTIVISHAFAIPGWKSVQTHPVHDLYNTNIYVYQF